MGTVKTDKNKFVNDTEDQNRKSLAQIRSGLRSRDASESRFRSRDSSRSRHFESETKISNVESNRERSSSVDLQDDASSYTSVEKEEVYRTHNFRKERSKHERREINSVERASTDTAKAESEVESLKRSSMGLQKESHEKIEQKSLVDAFLAFKETNQQLVENESSKMESKTSIQDSLVNRNQLKNETIEKQNVQASSKSSKSDKKSKVSEMKKTEKKKDKIKKKKKKKKKKSKNKSSLKKLGNTENI